MSRFELIDYSRSLIQQLRPLHASIKRHDADLAKQLRRAAASIHLNIREGQHSQGGRRTSRYFDAMLLSKRSSRVGRVFSVQATRASSLCRLPYKGTASLVAAGAPQLELEHTSADINEFATDFGYIAGHSAESTLDRVIAILWKLTR